MILRIMKEYTPPVDQNTMVVKSTMLGEKGVHLFIASHKWDKIVVELHQELVPSTLHYLHSVTDIIEVTCDEDLSNYLSSLVELYPDRSGALRRAVMQKQSVTSVLGDNVLCRA